MSSAHTRSQKGKAAPKMSGRGAQVAAKAEQGDSDVRPGAGSTIGAQEREMLVARAAYFRAEKRGFAPGRELQDWVEAETEVLRLIGSA
jgi:hypothetical protein